MCVWNLKIAQHFVAVRMQKVAIMVGNLAERVEGWVCPSFAVFSPVSHPKALENDGQIGRPVQI